MLSNKIFFMMELSIIRFIIGIFIGLCKEVRKGERLVRGGLGSFGKVD